MNVMRFIYSFVASVTIIVGAECYRNFWNRYYEWKTARAVELLTVQSLMERQYAWDMTALDSSANVVTNVLVWEAGGTNLVPRGTVLFGDGPEPTTRPRGTIQVWRSVNGNSTNLAIWHFQWDKPKRWDVHTGEEL